jgi:hypothetical protein
MSKYILTASIVWVGLSLIIGVLFISSSPRSIIFLNKGDAREAREPKENGGSVSDTVQTQVRIEGTGVGTPSVVPTKLNVVK